MFMSGGENLPSSGPALLIFYHGALPVDYYFLVADTLLHRGRCGLGRTAPLPLGLCLSVFKTNFFGDEPEMVCL